MTRQSAKIKRMHRRWRGAKTLPQRRADGWTRHAFLLLAVLMVVSVVTLAALSLSERMYLANEETQLVGKQAQAQLAADSGIDAVRLFLAKDKATRIENGGVWNNPSYFQAANIVADTNLEKICNFSILAPGLEAGSFAGLRYGLQNESARLNINALW